MKLIKRCYVFVSLKHLAQVDHGCCFSLAQFAVAVGIPVLHAEGLHIGIGESDERHDIEILPKLGSLVGSLAASRDIQRGVGAVGES